MARRLRPLANYDSEQVLWGIPVPEGHLGRGSNKCVLNLVFRSEIKFLIFFGNVQVTVPGPRYLLPVFLQTIPPDAAGGHHNVSYRYLP
jgi:hypothetical protein